MSKEEPKKNHWYEMYELECLRTKELQNQIETDAKRIIALQKQNGELTDKVNDLEDKLANADYQLEGRDNEIRELEALNEKMKCPQNCRYGSISVWCDNSISIDCEKEKYLHEDNWCDFCKKCKEWEIKEK
jgi:chromosome segregation ATPase